MSASEFPVTGGSEARLFGQVRNAMAIESDRYDNDDDPLERTELARRLRRMEWPPAPDDVKARVLQRIVDRSKKDGLGDEPSSRD